MRIALKPIEEQVVVVTCAHNPTGMAVADAIARRGGELVLAAPDEAWLEPASACLCRCGRQAMLHEADVGDREQIEALACATIERFGRIDTWINNPSMCAQGRLEEQTIDDSRRLFDTNFWGVVHGSLAALPYLRISGGALINVCCDAHPTANGMHAASTTAAKCFTESLKSEVGDDALPISVSFIQPGADAGQHPDPGQLAADIVRAAEHPMRRGRLGLMARIASAMSRLVPQT